MGLYIGINKSKHWTDKWYGVEWDVAMATPEMARIGNMVLHRQQPIASLMRRCVLNDAGVVVYYTHPTNGLLKNDETAAVLDGTDGQWMVEVPEHYFREEFVNTKCRWMFSQYPLPDFTLIPKHYVSVAEATVQRSANKLASVINATADYRGGNNNAAWDAEGRTLLGKPATLLSRTQFRTYAQARGAGWCLDIPTTYNAWRRLLFAEFATRNIQQSFTPCLNADGFRQGGLGVGVTNTVDANWTTYNSKYPFINCGATASLGNASGVVDVTIANFDGAGVNKTFSVPSYRGIENPFGHIWKWLDGYNIYHQTDVEGGKSLLYFRDLTTGLLDGSSTGYELAGNNLSRVESWVKTMMAKHLFPSATGGAGTGSTTYWCDYYYANVVANAGWCAPLVGGIANRGSSAGPVCVISINAASSTYTYIGSRLCFLGA